jgi:hypothetical protein
VSGSRVPGWPTVERTANYHGWTALIVASGGGHLDVSRFLLESGADVNAANDYGYTALMVASSGGHIAMVHSPKEPFEGSRREGLCRSARALTSQYSIIGSMVCRGVCRGI